MQQQTDTQLRDFGNRFKSTQPELPQRVETLVKLSLELRNDLLQDQLQQKRLEAQTQHLRLHSVVWNYEFEQAPMKAAEPIASSLQSLLYASASDDERNIATDAASR
ncbi:uncharacterized protein PITG_08114 [Phytophthora infestans T30-4]|uniref:Uncharacterized protein n=1 Tax=Phytophthora infestans (strain T30-4) TaxID=403677 RepID=D0N9I0_PHYIT|nr:uncharacterized protein PITG_08114 [Phytophthora infestans T30-4]EEY54468.1 conserved hypothetical protein [Phytophthora infestans T30-4]|eukprot:XP_002904290.1 conserved hypothetical protein [Phytophthora infestans T30-4]